MWALVLILFVLTLSFVIINLSNKALSGFGDRQIDRKLSLWLLTQMCCQIVNTNIQICKALLCGSDMSMSTLYSTSNSRRMHDRTALFFSRHLNIPVSQTLCTSVGRQFQAEFTSRSSKVVRNCVTREYVYRYLQNVGVQLMYFVLNWSENTFKCQINLYFLHLQVVS